MDAQPRISELAHRDPGFGISEEDFRRVYGASFETRRAHVSRFLEELEVERVRATNDRQAAIAEARQSHRLPAPNPDLFAYRSTLARGFQRFPERLKNFIVAESEPFRETVNYLPARIDIEPNSRCNFRCVMCQVSGWPGGKRAGDMSLEDFRAFVDHQYGLTEVKLQGMGEPLMHKGFIDMIAHLVSKDIWTRTTVNGSLLHHADAYKRLVDSGIGDVNISVDGADKEVFEKIRVRSDFDLVIKNLKLFNDYANTKNRKMTMMWVVLQQQNRHQLVEFVELAQRCSFRRVTFSVGLTDWGQAQWADVNSKFQSDRLSNAEIETLTELGDRYGMEICYWDMQNKFDATGDVSRRCHWPFRWGFVGSDSRTSPCCMIGNPDVINLGPAATFTETWNGPDYRAFRKAHLEGRIPQECRSCYKNTSS